MEQMDLVIDRNSPVPPYMQIVSYVMNAVDYDQLPTGEKLPSTRKLAKQLGVNPNTVVKAYGELKRRGLATGNGRTGVHIIALDATAQDPMDRLVAEVGEKAALLGLSMEEAVRRLAHRVGLDVVRKPPTSIVFLQTFSDHLERHSAQLEEALGVTVHRMRSEDLRERFEEQKPILDEAAFVVGNTWELSFAQEVFEAHGVKYETVLVGEEMTPRAVEQALAIPEGRRIGLVCAHRVSLGIDERQICTQTGREYRFLKAAFDDDAALSVLFRECDVILYTRPCQDLLLERCPKGIELIHLENCICHTSIEVLRKKLSLTG